MAEPRRFSLQNGCPDAAHDRAAALYWDAFSAKLAVPLGPAETGRAFLSAHFDPKFAISALGADGVLLGIAGFKTAEGALTGGDFAAFRRHYGLSAFWRVVAVALLERDLEPDVLVMDGICVAPEARGLGIGTALLQAIKDKAKALGLARVRLDVIDSNPRARALYLREGFVSKRVETMGPLRHVYGFRSAERMEYAFADVSAPRRNAAN